MQKSKRTPGKGRSKGDGKTRRYSYTFKLSAVEMHLKKGVSQTLVQKQLGMSKAVYWRWLSRYRKHGPAGLEGAPLGRKGRAQVPDAVKEQIVELKRLEPKRGVRRISDILGRIFFMKASPETVRKTLHASPCPPEPRAKLRAKRKVVKRKKQSGNDNAYVSGPQLMWQSDICVFRWKKHEDVFLIGFLDDYSRLITGIGVYLEQTVERVLQVFRKASADLGAPKEILTDNGRQYASWRGESKFTAELRKGQIRHIRSRPHHPQTQGKIERFWKTIKEEFLTKTTFRDLKDLQERVRLWVQYYNFQRQHQALDGHCPADVYYETASEVRRVVEQGIEANALQMAMYGIPKPPVYLVGRMDQQSVMLVSESGRLKLQVNDIGSLEKQEVVYPQDKQNNIMEGNRENGEAKGNGSETPEEGNGKTGDGNGALPCGAVGVDGAADALGGVQGVIRSVDDTSVLAETGHGGDVAGAGTESEPGEGACAVTPASGAAGGTGEGPAGAAVAGTPEEPACAAAGVDCGEGQVNGDETSTERGIDERRHGGETELGHFAGPERPDDGSASSGRAGCLPKDVLRVGEEGADSDGGLAGGWGRRPSRKWGRPGEGGPEEGGGQAETGVGCGPRVPACPPGAECLHGETATGRSEES